MSPLHLERKRGNPVVIFPIEKGDRLLFCTFFCSLKLGPGPILSQASFFHHFFRIIAIRFGDAKKYDIFCMVRAVETTEVLAVKHDKGLCFSGNKWYIG